MDRRRFIESLTLGTIAAATVGLEADAAPKERHPMIRRAIVALHGAKNELEHADTDFGGHRADALQAVNNALDQLQQALKYDKK